jgi:hypothetical protein
MQAIHELEGKCELHLFCVHDSTIFINKGTKLTASIVVTPGVWASVSISGFASVIRSQVFEDGWVGSVPFIQSTDFKINT